MFLGNNSYRSILKDRGGDKMNKTKSGKMETVGKRTLNVTGLNTNQKNKLLNIRKYYNIREDQAETPPFDFITFRWK